MWRHFLKNLKIYFSCHQVALGKTTSGPSGLFSFYQMVWLELRVTKNLIFFNKNFFDWNKNYIPNIFDTFQLIQGILLAVSAKPLFKSKKKSPKNNEANDALSSQRSGVNWPFADLKGVCKTKTLDWPLTQNGCDKHYLDFYTWYYDYYVEYYENHGCPGTTFCGKGNFRSKLTIRVYFMVLKRSLKIFIKSICYENVTACSPIFNSVHR